MTAARVDPASASVDEGSRRRITLAPDGTRDELVGAILRAAAGAADPAIRRWGIAAPGPFDYEKGVFRIRGVGKLEALYGVDLRGKLVSSLELGEGTSIRFLNDADAFLLGESWAGAARGHARAIGLTLGTGLGSAFLADGQIVHEGRGVFPGGRAHVLEFRGRPVEDTISRRGLLARYGAGADGSIDVKEIADRARTGEQLAHRTFADFAGSLAEFLTPCLSAFAPTCLVIGGSIAHAWDLIGLPLERRLAPVEAINVVTAAAQIEDAPLLGAARAAA